ncbi:MAG TPA: ABC transporter ATP-binding protein [Abditibacteriaceae bacterium]|jgi:heme exporter protein A
MLHASDLGKRFGARVVFRRLSFGVPVGRAVAVVGSNGSGKSTLLKIVAGLVRASAGTVSWNGEISGRELGSLCGLAAPDAPLYRELTALENLRFLAELRGSDSSEASLLAHLESWGLKTRANDFAGDLSSGLRMRLQLAAATLHRPPVLLLDEPSAHLDEAGRALLRGALARQRERGIVLVATNDQREVDLCDERIDVLAGPKRETEVPAVSAT